MIRIVFLLFLSSFGFSNSYGQLVSDVNLLNSKKGYIFTTVHINGVKARVMIDFGDPQVLQVSSSFVKKNGILVESTKQEASDVFGNKFKINKGKIKSLNVSDVVLEEVGFLSSENELEQVSKDVGVKFDAVLGWGFFKQYKLKVNYKENIIQLYKELPEIPPHFSKVEWEEGDHLICKAKIDTIKTAVILDTGSPFNIIDSTWYDKVKPQISSVPSKIKYKLIFKLTQERIETSLGNDQKEINYLIYNLPEISKVNCVGILGYPFFENHILIFDPQLRLMYFN